MNKIKDNYNCALNLTFDLLGGKWKLRVLWHIIHGDNRFSLMMKNIEDISEKVLMTQLKDLEQSKIIKRIVICDKPVNVIYEICNDYSSIIGLIDNLCDFSNMYALKNNISLKE